MKQWLYTQQEDICAANGKDANKQAELLKVMTHYGTVEDFESVEKRLKAKYQAVIDNLNAQLEAIKEQNLTPDEIAIVVAYRKSVGGVVAQKDARIGELNNQLENVSQQMDDMRNRIKAVLGD